MKQMERMGTCDWGRRPGSPGHCLPQQNCCHGRDGFKVSSEAPEDKSRTNIHSRGIISAQQTEDLPDHVQHSEMAGRSPCQVLGSAALKIFTLRMELREGTDSEVGWIDCHLFIQQVCVCLRSWERQQCTKDKIRLSWS